MRHSLLMALALVAVFAMAAASSSARPQQGTGNSDGGGGGARAVLSCAPASAPCEPYLNSTGTLPAACCGPLREAAANETACLCAILLKKAVLQAFGVAPQQGLLLAKHCGVTTDASAYSKSAATDAGTHQINKYSLLHISDDGKPLGPVQEPPVVGRGAAAAEDRALEGALGHVLEHKEERVHAIAAGAGAGGVAEEGDEARGVGERREEVELVRRGAHLDGGEGGVGEGGEVDERGDAATEKADLVEPSGDAAAAERSRIEGTSDP
ncbi:hypothetical protein ACP70R_006183 [Stipagrostis hirtigluma subsp. patula]